MPLARRPPRGKLPTRIAAEAQAAQAVGQHRYSCFDRRQLCCRSRRLHFQRRWQLKTKGVITKEALEHRGPRDSEKTMPSLSKYFIRQATGFHRA